MISTCLTHTYEIGAATLGVPLDRVEVRVSAENNDARFLGIETTDPALPYNVEARISIEANNATPAQLDTLHKYASERCPMTNLIRGSTPVTVIVESA